MTACNRFDCTGEIDETGFCGSCLRRPLAEVVEPDPEPPPPPPDVASSGQVWTVARLVDLPVLDSPDPSSRILDADNTVGSQRICGKNGCTGEVGGSYADQSSLQEGFCPACGTAFSFLPKLRAGDLVASQYEVMGPLAQSGFGWVYLARDRHLDDNYVVLKGLVNANDSRAAEMAVRERQYLTRLSHPNIVRIYNAVTDIDRNTGEHAGYIVMEYVDGSSLEELVRSARRSDQPGQTLPLEHILAMGHEILAAMAYLHSRGLLYCDMKPDNVIRGRDRITVIDLGGICRIDEENRSPVGTHGFQVDRGEIKSRGATVRSDIHTIGKTLERLQRASAGRRPPVRAADTDIALDSFHRLIKRATDRDWNRRFTSADEMSEQLTGVLRELLSQRDEVEHATASTLFAPTAALIDGDLSTVPPLSRWTGASTTTRLRPSTRSVFLGLPLPRVDPADPAARFLTDGTSPPPRDMIDRLVLAGDGSPELRLRAARAHLELGDLQAAARCLRQAEGQAEPWRVTWYTGLLKLADDDVPAAIAAFGAVRDSWPGEVAPKLALALCQERSERRQAAERLFQAVWLRDRSQTGAAFGLARLRLAEKDRTGATTVLDQVPILSPHRDAAGIAAFRALIEQFGGVGPSVAELKQAADRLPKLRLDGGEPDGDARQRLTAMIRQAALGVRPIPAAIAPGEAPGRPSSEQSLRRLLEQSYRDLARQARTADDHEALVDRANQVRPRTLLTGWRG